MSDDPGPGPGATRPSFASLPAEALIAVVESSDDAILTKDLEGRITSWNPGAARLYGYEADEVVGRPVSLIIPPHREGEDARILASVLEGKPVDHYETERVAKDGRQVVVSLTVSPIKDESGKVVGASAIAREITAQHRTRELGGRLQELTSELARRVLPDEVIEAVLEKAVGGLGAGAGTVGLLDEAGEEIVLAGSAGYSEEGIANWARFSIDAEVPLAVALRTAEGVWTSTREELRGRFPALEETELPFASLAAIPLATDAGEAFGALALSFAEARPFDTEERDFLLECGRQAARALERARLYEAERRANERLEFLAEASTILSGTLDLQTALEQLASLSVRSIADWCGVDLLAEDGSLDNVAVAHVDPAKVRMARELRERYPADPDADRGAPGVVRTGEPELYPEIPDAVLVETAQDDEHLRLIRELGLRSAMIVPLAVRGQVLGALTLVASESGRRFDESELSLAMDLARRAALAIDNSLLFKREHEAALVLQRALLPRSLPDVEGVELAVRYMPAGPGLEVGGDWYDIARRGDGTLAMSIGDVAGRGVPAASIMGRVRPELHAFMSQGGDPAEALVHAHRVLRDLDEETMATVLQVNFDPRDGSLLYARAGHPPAVLRRPDGRVTMLAGKGAPPLGVFDDCEPEVHSASLEPGSLLLLYTDGLIERRSEPLTSGLERLDHLMHEAPESAESCADWLIEQLGGQAIPDDVALLVMRSTGASA